MKKQKTKFQTLNELEEEKRKLYVSKENPQRLKEIIKKLDYFYFGLK
jgi:predicted transcriptional regulator